MHLSHPRRVEFSNEAIFITKGKVQINFLDDLGNTLLSRVLGEGDVILLMDGGHSFDIIEDARMIEVKQGPLLDFYHPRILDNIERMAAIH